MSAKDKAVVEPYALSAALKECLKDCRILYVTAPVGWGKTTAVRHHFRTRLHTYVHYKRLWQKTRHDGETRRHQHP